MPALGGVTQDAGEKRLGLVDRAGIHAGLDKLRLPSAQPRDRELVERYVIESWSDMASVDIRVAVACRLFECHGMLGAQRSTIH